MAYTLHDFKVDDARDNLNKWRDYTEEQATDILEVIEDLVVKKIKAQSKKGKENTYIAFTYKLEEREVVGIDDELVVMSDSFTKDAFETAMGALEQDLLDFGYKVTTDGQYSPTGETQDYSFNISWSF